MQLIFASFLVGNWIPVNFFEFCVFLRQIKVPQRRFWNRFTSYYGKCSEKFKHLYFLKTCKITTLSIKLLQHLQTKIIYTKGIPY